MKRVRKWSIVAAVLLIVTMLAGCGEAAKTEFKAPKDRKSVV